MKALLDTNIVIHREVHKVFNKEIGTLFSWLDKLGYEKCIHPATVQEIQKISDNNHRDIMDVKLKSYYTLKTCAPFSDQIKKISEENDKSDNDKIDTQILNEVNAERVDILVTEDKKIHHKAQLLNISDKVFKIDTFLEKVISENPNLIDYKVLSVKNELFGNIDIEDPFFDSFREDYIGFNSWFNKKAEEKAYICYNEDVLSAFLYIKKEDEKENYSDITPTLPPKIRLKIGTFKVIKNGIRLGERFLKIIFEHAKLYKVQEIYVTIFDKSEEQKRLIALLQEWGFVLWGNKGKELVYIREFTHSFNIDNPKLTYPFLSKEPRENRVFLVPIYPEYHTELLPDSILNTEKAENFQEGLTHRNAISKVYISHSSYRNLKKGDIMLFYRTGGYHKSVVTTFGIIEDVFDNISSLDELANYCKKRTFFNLSDLTSIWTRYPTLKPFAVKFLCAYSLKKRLNLKRLIELGVITGIESVPRGFTEITWDQLTTIVKEAKI